MPGRGKRTRPVDDDSSAAAHSWEAPWLAAAHAAESKKASRIRVLDVQALTSFADYFVICSGGNQRQIQAIAEEVELRLKEQGRRPLGIEGHEHAEWVLVDYGDFLVHVFSESARAFYDLERLWRRAEEVEIPAAE